MKRNCYRMVMISLLFLVMVIFQYEGTPKLATATSVAADETYIPLNQDVSSIEKDLIEEPDELANSKIDNVGKENESSELVSEIENKVIDNQNQAAENSSEEIVKVANDEITIDGDRYVNIMHEEKFAALSNIAQKNDATLYAIPYSDCFAIVKDEAPIFQMSTGIATSLVEDSEILLEFFADDDFKEYTGLLENIETVLETGKEVNIDLGNYLFYNIYEENGAIFVLW
ncbi:hypothetical protein [Bacillus niameyensis]|uniref:hypothetical protein n=1 Tax=Bacillus niameyensis TaxID=1522308 RepID=UPI00078655BD|nr:hypothetical protein [Bacillus niameyensis]